MTNAQLWESIETQLNQSTERIDKAGRAPRQAMSESAKMFVTLASSALVLSITAFYLPPSEGRDPLQWTGLLFASWFLFGTTAFLGAYQFYQMANGLSSWFVFETEHRAQLRKDVMRIDLSTEDAIDQASALIMAALARPVEIEKTAKAIMLVIVPLILLSFLGGLVCFGIFAVKNFPG